MAEVLLFHHAQGLTPGVVAFADELRAAGHTVPGARGALFFSAALQASEFGGSWPRGLPLQIHMMEGDEWAEEDLPAARELVESTDLADLFLYPGSGHLFADSSLPDYDESAANLLKQRVVEFLED
jgi:dienelactone hydrolase